MTGCRCLIPVSLGELLDKITILEIKVLHLKGEGLAHGIQELSLLRQVLGDLAFPVEQERFSALKSVNQSLWTIEDAICDNERQGQFELAVHFIVERDLAALGAPAERDAILRDRWSEFDLQGLGLVARGHLLVERRACKQRWREGERSGDHRHSQNKVREAL